MKEILFVCTGNIFRSMTAEHAARHSAGQGAPYRFSSAGTQAEPLEMAVPVRQNLLARGIDPTSSPGSLA